MKMSFCTKIGCPTSGHLPANTIGSKSIDYEYLSLSFGSIQTCANQEKMRKLTDTLKQECVMRYSILLIFILLPVLAFADTRREMRDLELPSRGIDTLVIKCGAGFLKLKGIEKQDKIQVVAEIFVEGLEEKTLNTFFKKNLLLHLEQQGTKAVLRSVFIRPTHINPQEAKIDMTVRVPINLNVKIDDNSGSISVNDLIGDLEIDDGSGLIKIENIIGDVRVLDTSGTIEIEELRGNVYVKDGSGELNINLIEGDVNVVDGFGSIKIQDIDGHVKVWDGSGSIEVHDISKDVSILESDSGEISIEGVKGAVIRRDINTPEEENDINDDAE
jgi:hypothetical protein